jgi:AraC-like DNA-binding protein
MHYREVRPTPLLTSSIECFWVLEGAAERAVTAPERLLPDGCVELILNFEAPFREYSEGGTSALQPAQFVVGQMTRPVLVAPTGGVQLLGIRFRPGGTLPFLRLPPRELTDRIVPLTDVAPALARELAGPVGAAQTLREKLSCCEALLLRWSRTSAAPRDALLQHALAQILRREGRLAIEQLAMEVGLSRRQLERRFIEEVGLSPKLLCRILRFQQVFRAVERAAGNWAELALACGYYDQAHLSRDFRQFAGKPPALLFEDFSRLAELFTRKHRVSHFSKPWHEILP